MENMNYEEIEDVGVHKLLNELEKSKQINPEKTLNTLDGAFWLELVDCENNSVEGKLFLSKSNKDNVITIVIPGMLGDINTEIEESWKDELLKLGDLFVARHNGLNLKSEITKNSIHCEEKENSNWGFTGDKNKKYSPLDFCKEPETIMEVLGSKYDSINIVSHSFGSFEVAHMLGSNKLPKELEIKIKKLVSLSGWTGKTPDNSLKVDYRKAYSEWLDFVRKTNSLNIIEDDENFFSEIEELFLEIDKISENIEVVSVNPSGDEMIGIGAGKNLQNIAVNSLLIKDETESLSNQNSDVHSFRHLKILPRLLSMHVYGKHIVTTKNG